MTMLHLHALPQLLSLTLTLPLGAFLLAARGGGTSDTAAVPGLLQDHHPAAVKCGAGVLGEATGQKWRTNRLGREVPGTALVRTACHPVYQCKVCKLNV